MRLAQLLKSGAKLEPLLPSPLHPGFKVMAQATNTVTIEQRLDDLITSAHDVCSTNGTISEDCAAAWDAVEEVQAEISHRRTRMKTALVVYCDDHPEAPECRIYDV